MNKITQYFEYLNNYIEFKCNDEKLKKIILDFEEYKYKVIKVYHHDNYHTWITMIYKRKPTYIKKHGLFGELIQVDVLEFVFDVDINIEDPKYSKSHVASVVNSSFCVYKDKLARQAEIYNGDII